jgi:homogentisate 1,2-dioxygenase
MNNEPLNTTQHTSGAVDVTVHNLVPSDRVRFGDGEHTVVVEEGVVYLLLEDDELALIQGNEVVIPHGQLWYASSVAGPARVAVLSRSRR